MGFLDSWKIHFFFQNDIFCLLFLSWETELGNLCLAGLVSVKGMVLFFYFSDCRTCVAIGGCTLRQNTVDRESLTHAWWSFSYIWRKIEIGLSFYVEGNHSMVWDPALPYAPFCVGWVLTTNARTDYCWVPESCEHLKGNVTRNGK